jgi:hypothetical protein
MRIVLKKERILYVLENHILLVINKDIDDEVKIEYQCHIDDNKRDICVMLSSISLKLQT